MWWICLFLPWIVWANDPLIVGMELTYPPFETVDFAGDPDGISPALAKHLAEYLDRPLKIVSIPFVGLIPSLVTEKIDLILSSMSVTQERKKAIAFSDPYLEIGLALLISKSSNLKSIDDADEKRRRIVVKLGTTGADWAAEHLKHAQIRVLDQESSCILEVVQGKADAFIYDQISVWRAWKKYRSRTRANLHPIQIEQWSIGLRKGDDELLDQVNAFLRAFKKEGGFEKLANQYLSEEKEAFEKQKIPFVF